MQMLILLLAAGTFGYLLSMDERGDLLQDGAEQALSAAQSWSRDLSERLFPLPLEMQLKTWALGDGSRHFPRQFRDWLAALSGRKLKDFAHALCDYLEGLDYKPGALFRGDLDHQPELLQAHAQAILAYSQVYRQAKLVQGEEIYERGER